MSAFHKRQVAKIAATLNPPRQPRKWARLFEEEVSSGKEEFEITSFKPLSPQSSLADNSGWEYQENGFSYSNRPK